MNAIWIIYKVVSQKFPRKITMLFYTKKILVNYLCSIFSELSQTKFLPETILLNVEHDHRDDKFGTKKTKFQIYLMKIYKNAVISKLREWQINKGTNTFFLV